MIQLNLSPEIEEALVRRAEAVGKDVASFIGEFVTERLAADDSLRPKTYEEAEPILKRILDRHAGVTGFVDDSRESIYAGRGE